MERQPVHIINASGEFSPFTLLKISQVFRKMAAGEILEIRECDPETRSDILRILPPDTCRLIIDAPVGSRDSRAEAPPPCRIQLLKTAARQQD
jgi:TusA-related sulfurtransferase